MKGKILDYVIQRNEGFISGDDGNRYRFSGVEWKGQTLPMIGSTVDFVVENGEAKGIYVSAGATSGLSKRTAAVLLALFLGAFGAHKFYLGYTKQAVIMLVTAVVGLGLHGFPTMILGIIAFIEGIIYITKTDSDFEQTYVVGRKPWF